MTNFLLQRWPWAILSLLIIIQPAHAWDPTDNPNAIVLLQSSPWGSGSANQTQAAVRPAILDKNDPNYAGLNELWPNSISYTPQTTPIAPFINPDLSLGVELKYHFDIDVSARNSKGERVSIPNGWYQMQLAVISTVKTENPYDRYVTSTSNIVMVSNGSLSQSVSLRFPSAPYAVLKYHLYVELIPLDNLCSKEGPNGPIRKVPCIKTKSNGKADPTNSILKPLNGYKSYLVEMPLTPYLMRFQKRSDAYDIEPGTLPFKDVSLADYIAKAQMHVAKRLFASRARQTPEEYAKANKLNFMYTDDPILIANPTLSRGEIGDALAALGGLLKAASKSTIKLTQVSEPLMKVLCSTLNAKNKQYQILTKDITPMSYGSILTSKQFETIELCSLYSNRVFRMTKVTHLGQTKVKDAQVFSQDNLGYFVSGNYSLDRSKSKATSTSISASGKGLAFKALGLLGLNLEALDFIDVSTSVSTTNSRGQSESNATTVSSSFNLSYLSWNIPTTGSQSCIEVRPLDRAGQYFKDNSRGALNGLYICERPNRNSRVLSETYAHIFSTCDANPLMDCNDPLTTSTNFVMRGDRDISAFFYLMRGGLNPQHGDRLKAFSDFPGADKFFGNTPSPNYMQIVTPIEFSNESIPSVVTKLLGGYSEVF